MTRFTRLCSGRQLALGALLLSGCGLGAAGTTAQNNATSDPISAPTTPISPTSTTLNGTDNTTPAVTPTETSSGQTNTGGQTTPATPTTPVTSTPPVVVPGTPTTTTPVVTTPTTNPATTPGAADDLFNIKALRYSFFDYNEATGAFVLVLTDDGKFCLHRPLGLAEANSHELKISATMTSSAFGGAQQMTLSNLQSTLTQLSAQCQPTLEAQLQSGSFAVTNLTSTAASGNFSFQMAIAGMAPQPVAANFASTPCAGLRGGVPAIVTCL